MMTSILVIEDDEAIRANLREFLTHYGYEVRVAADGERGVQAALAQVPDLIVCDLSMPRMSGYDVLEALRDTPATAKTPFLFLTAFDDRDHMRHGMRLGADDYLTKPCEPDELRDAIEARLRRLGHYEADLDEAKRSIARMISHELRTPLSGIVMANEMLSRNLDTMSPRDLREILSISENGGRRLQRVTDQIALKTQIDADFVSADALETLGQPLRFWEVLGEAVKLARENAYRNAKLPIRAKVPPDLRDVTVLGVERNLRTALLELLHNALVYSPRVGQVRLRGWVERGYVCLVIRDAGPGIPPDQLEQALAPFSQLGREKSEQQGLGLGLYLAAHIIRAHHGVLAFNTEIDEGLAVRVALPLLEDASSSGQGTP